MRRPAEAKAARSQSGSAYLIVLLALVVLTILGLSLSTITQIEMEVGSNERGIVRTFYAADSGISIAVAQALLTGEYRSRSIELLSETVVMPNVSQSLNRGYRIDVSHMVPINPQPCNLCSINMNEENFWRVNHAITSRATELTWTENQSTPPPDASIQAQKTLSAMIDVQPWFEPVVESLPTDPAELAKIKL